MNDTTGLAAANAERCARAAERNTRRADAAMRWLMDQPSGSTPTEKERQNRYWQACYGRAAHPEATLAELAEKYGLTKDAYAARLRRGLELAERAL